MPSSTVAAAHKREQKEEFTNTNTNTKNIAQAYASGKYSTLIVIDIEIARRLGIDKPSNLTVEETKDGVLIKKLKI
jgi:hypothetical protein